PGPLSAVGDLKVDVKNARPVTILWSAPFSLDVTGVDPDIWYSVLIYNVTDENNPTAILCTDCINITETHYTFTPDYLSPCHVYNFSVIPLNGAGQGESSPNITGYVLNLLALIKTHIRAISRDESKVTFKSNHTSEICSSWRVTPDVADDDLVIEEPPSPEGPDVTYQLRADNRYSFLVSLPLFISRAAPPRINFTTYDVQSAAASNGTNNKINLTGEFIESTTAQGCFIVLKSEYRNPDVFRALLLPDDSSTYIQSTIHDILSSTYHVLVYDLEEDGLPNSHPAVEQTTNVTVLGNGPIADAESQFLNNGSVYVNETSVNVTCEFKEGIEGASCVLVYREYGNKTLVVEEYPQNTVFPVTLTVDDDLENYTFAIFGKDGSMVDQRPIIAGRMNVTETTTPTTPTTPAITVSTSSDGRRSSIAIGVSVTVSFVIITLVILAVVMLIWWKKSHKVGYSSFSRVVHSCFCCPSLSETNYFASGESSSQLISNDGGTQQQIDGYAEGPPRSTTTSHLRQDGGISVSTPPVMSKQKGIYTDVEPSTSGVQPPIPEDSRVQYQEIDIRTTHKMARSQYADLGPIPANQTKPLEMDTRTQCPYVTILPHATTPVNDSGNRDKKNVVKATPKGPPTVDSVMSLLWGVAGRWKEIAEGLEFDEDLIDEIDTNNDMNEGCLQVCVEMWVTKLEPSWEKLSHVLRDLGEVELARQALSGPDNCQLQTMNRQISSSSSGIGSAPVTPRFKHEGTDCSEVVPGVSQQMPPIDCNSGDIRGGKKTMSSEWSEQKQGVKAALMGYPTLKEGDPSSESERNGESGESECDYPLQCCTDDGSNTVVIPGTTPSIRLFPETCCYSSPLSFMGDVCLVGENILIPGCEHDTNDNHFKPTEREQGNEDLHRDFVCATKPSAIPKSDYPGAGGRKVQTGTVEVTTHQLPDHGHFNEAEILSSPSEYVEGFDACERVSTKCVNSSTNHIAFSVLNEVKGCMVTGDLFPRVVNDEVAQRMPKSVAGKTPLSRLSFALCIGNLISAELRCASVLQVPHKRSPVPPEPQENNPMWSPTLDALDERINFLREVMLLVPAMSRSPQPPPRPKSNKKKMKVATPFKKYQGLTPPENFHEKIIKWMHCGVALGFNGLGNKIHSGSYPAKG
ncbi:hypothetical protein GBAR_LOCUS3172, partial [Geodia barretti]